MPERSVRRVVVGAAAVLAVLGLLVACGGEDPQDTPGTPLPPTTDGFAAMCGHLGVRFDGVRPMSEAGPHPIALFQIFAGAGSSAYGETDLAPQPAAAPSDVQLVGCIGFASSDSDTPGATPGPAAQYCSYKGNAATVVAGTSRGLDGAATVPVEPTDYDLTVYEAATGRRIGVVPLGPGETADCPSMIRTVDGVPEKVYSTPSPAQYTAAVQQFTG